MDVIVTKTVRAAKQRHQKRIVVAGGVGANSKLRDILGKACEKEGIKMYVPAPILCTDNGVMIACAAYYKYQAGMESDFTLDAFPNLALDA